jgi:diguanylate cyclase (GGDEF)-like protein
VISALSLLSFFIYKVLKWREYSHELQKQALKNIIDTKTKKLQQANISLKKMSHLDGLKGLSNLYYLDEYINKLIVKNIKNMIIMMMDMDDFKQYNDLNGHIEGDELLKSTAQHLLSAINDSSAIIARYGGEEFLVILLDCSLEKAQKKAEEIRQLIENKDKMTSISIGICESSNQSTVKSIDAIYDLIDRADKALYSAKNQGRNRVIICDQ